MRRTKQQWAALVAKQRDSGLSAAEFCRKHKLNAKYFSLQKCKLKRFPDLEQASSFIKLNTEVNRPHALQYPNTVNLTFGEACLSIPAGAPAGWVADLIKALNQ